MIQIVWQYEVKEENRAKFELAYGPGGAWSTLFARASGDRGTALLRDTQDLRRYLAIDAWDTEEHHQEFLNRHSEEYEAMDAGFSEIVDSEAKVGTYKLLADATVRPIPRSARRRSSPYRTSQ
ncbi:MAG: antibiotic biosynthesis monooxygenase family protein [Candidatus Methylomirabilis sp.]